MWGPPGRGPAGAPLLVTPFAYSWAFCNMRLQGKRLVLLAGRLATLQGKRLALLAGRSATLKVKRLVLLAGLGMKQFARLRFAVSFRRAFCTFPLLPFSGP